MSGAPHAVLEALMYSLNNRGPSALAEPDTQRRLSQMSEEQLAEIGRRLTAPTSRRWSIESLTKLINLHEELR